MAGLTIQEMRLTSTAAQAALMVLKLHPEAVFTSGRRDIMDQARAMAQNAVRYGSGWLASTYKDQRIVNCLMTYMEENPEQCSNSQVLSQRFHEQLQEHFAADLLKFPHVRGDAFDIQYPRLKNGLHDVSTADRIMATIRQLPEYGIPLEWVTDREGKLRVIHMSVKPTAVTV